MNSPDRDLSNRRWPAVDGEMARLIRHHDWGATSLGPVGSWSTSLRNAVDLMLPVGFPSIVLWGPDLSQIYNDRYRELMGTKHPAGLGQATRDCWPEVWHINEPIYQRVFAGETLSFEDALYPLYVSGELTEKWFTISYSPLRDDSGVIAGVFVTLFEATDRILSQRALQESEDRLRALVAAGAFTLYRMSPDWRQMRHLDGRGFLADTPNPAEDWQQKYLLPEDKDEILGAIDEAIRTKSPFEREHRVRLLNGSVGWTLSRAVPIVDGQGNIVEWFGAAADITRRKRMEEALQNSESRFREFGEASSDILWIRNGQTLALEYISPAFDRIYGISRKELGTQIEHRLWNELLLTEDRAHARACIERVARGERQVFEFRVRRPDGAVRWIRNTAFPILDEAGVVHRIGGIGDDVTAEKETADRMGLLVAELQHRTRNLIAVINAIAQRTLTTSATMEEFGGKFFDRLAALSRVQGLLSRSDEEPITVAGLIRTELDALGAIDKIRTSRIRVSGPEVRLRNRIAQTLALALHELATNACKYGALRNEGGELSVEWSVIPGQGTTMQVRLEWIEAIGSGEPIDVATARPGYGRYLIERALPYQLRASTTYLLGRDGVRCTITLPLQTPDETCEPV